jgi:hypothetical protein
MSFLSIFRFVWKYFLFKGGLYLGRINILSPYAMKSNKKLGYFEVCRVRKDCMREKKGGDMKKKIFPSSHNIAFCFKVYLNDVVQLLSD